MSVFGILLVIGVIAAKTGVLPEDSLGVLSRLLVKIIMPCYIFTIVSATSVTPGDIAASAGFVGGALIQYLLLFAVGVATARLFKLKETTSNIHIACATFGNMGLLGLPLFQASVTSKYGIVCISVFILIEQFLVWTVGVYFCSAHIKQKSFFGNLKGAVNPVSIAMLLGLVFSLMGWRLPSLLSETVSGLGSTNKYLTFVYLGAMISCINIKSMFSKATLYVYILLKMLVLPLIVYVAAKQFLNPEAAFILMILTGLPSAVSPSLVSRNTGSDYEYATECLFLSTAISIGTIPLVTYIGLNLLK